MSVSCKHVLAALPDYLEKEAAPLEALETAAHLASCARCAAESKRTERLLGALRRMAPPPPTRDIAAGVLGSLRRLKRGAADRRALKWSALGLVAALLAADISRPRPLMGAPVRLLLRLGDLLDLGYLVDRIGTCLSKLVPTANFLNFAGDGGAGFVGGPHLPAQMSASLAFLGSSVCAALLTGLLLLGCRALSRAGRAHAPLFRLF